MRGLGRTLLLIVIMLLTLTMCGLSPAYGNNTEVKTITAIRTQTPPRIDGFIEPLWSQADSVTGFTQVIPDEGRPPTEKTVVYLLYDAQNLYVAFKCYNSEPDKLVLRVAPRDQAVGSVGGDYVGIILDTFNNKTTGYEFMVNAKGVQSDAYTSLGGEVEDLSWDGVQYPAAKITDFGYIVEMKIPFRSTRFKSGLSIWGISFGRYIARREEWAFWPPLKRNEMPIRVSKCSQLLGIHPGETGLPLEAYPVALVRYERPSISPDGGSILAGICRHRQTFSSPQTLTSPRLRLTPTG